MRVSFKISLLFFIWYHYYYYYYYDYFIVSCLWFDFWHIFSNFESTFFGLSSCEFFLWIPLCLIYIFTVFFSFSFFYFIFFYFLFFIFFSCLFVFSCLCVLHAYRSCSETYKISSRFESCFVLVFTHRHTYSIWEWWQKNHAIY